MTYHTPRAMAVSHRKTPVPPLTYQRWMDNQTGRPVYEALVSPEPRRRLLELSHTDPEALVSFMRDAGDPLLLEWDDGLDDTDEFDFFPWWKAFLQAAPLHTRIPCDPRWIGDDPAEAHAGDGGLETYSLATIASRSIHMHQEWIFDICAASDHEHDQRSAILQIRNLLYYLHSGPAERVITQLTELQLPQYHLDLWKEMTQVAMRRGQIGEIDLGIWGLGAIGPDTLKLPGDGERRILTVLEKQLGNNQSSFEGICAWAMQRHPVSFRRLYPRVVRALLLSRSRAVRVIAVQILGS